MIFPFVYGYWTLLAIPILLGGLYLVSRDFRRREQMQKNTLLQMRNWEHNWEFVRIKSVALLCAFFFFILAGFRPQWGMKEDVILYDGLDIMFAMDVSKSMHALDFSTQTRAIDRLMVAKELIKNFVQDRYSDRFGLVVFAGEPFVSVPLTFDKDIFIDFLESSSERDVSVQGTNLAEALGVSLERLTVQSESHRGKAIILITDGDETVNSKITQLATIAKKNKIPIFTVGIGSLQGVRIPEGRDVFGRTIYKKYKGKDVFTKLNERPLKQIAKITGGQYFHAEEFSDLKNISKDLKKLPTDILEDLNYTDREDRYQIFVLLGFLCLLVYFFLPNGKVVISPRFFKQ